MLNELRNVLRLLVSLQFKLAFSLLTLVFILSVSKCLKIVPQLVVRKLKVMSTPKR